MRQRLLIAALAAVVLSSCSSRSPAPVVPAPNSLSPHPGATLAPGWTSINIGSVARDMALGHDGFMYVAKDTGAIYKIDPISHQITTITLNGTSRFLLTPNPDGNMYAAEELSSGEALARISPDGQTTDIPLPGRFDSINSMITGSDQRIWMLRQNKNDVDQYLAAVTTEGKYRAFPTKLRASGLVRGPDKNLWSRSADGRVRFSIIDGSPTDFPDSTTLGLIPGPDGQFWGSADAKRLISSYNPVTQTKSLFPIRFRLDLRGGFFIQKDLHWVEKGYLYSFNIARDRIANRIPAPSPAGLGWSYEGPNHQLWDMDANYPGTVIYVYQF